MENLDKLAPALVALQADLKPVAKSAVNPFFKSSYAPLHEVMEAIQPLMAKHKLAISQFMSELEGSSALTTILLHESGQHLTGTTPLLLVKNDPQAQGSSVTYARRYGVMSALGIVADEDDDGNKATTASANQEDKNLLPKAKARINVELVKNGYELPSSKKAFIFAVLDKETIDNMDDAEEVMQAIENEVK